MNGPKDHASSCPVAIVTGASRGIGRELAIGLAQDGYHLVMVARDRETLASVLAEIRANDPAGKAEHSIFAQDVSDQQRANEAVAEIVEKYKRIDLLINNAGIYAPGTLDISTESFEEMIRVNLAGPFIWMKAVIPAMKKQKSGYVFNIASRAGRFGLPGEGAYGASKFGLVGLNESLYRELSKDGISLTSLCPSWVNTEMGKAGPLGGGEMIQPIDILKTVRWLLSLSPAARVREIIIDCKDKIL